MPTPDQMTRAADRRVRIVELIRESLRDRGYPPTVAELADATGVSHRQSRMDLDVLVDAGVIERDAGVPRGLRIKPRRAR